MKADLLVDVTLYPTEQGGRAGPTPANWLGCVCKKERRPDVAGWDCRLLLDGVPLAPGESRRIGIALLSGEAAAADLRQADGFFLWDGRVIGEAVIVR